jgi:hypothetical protein
VSRSHAVTQGSIFDYTHQGGQKYSFFRGGWWGERLLLLRHVALQLHSSPDHEDRCVGGLNTEGVVLVKIPLVAGGLFLSRITQK